MAWEDIYDPKGEYDFGISGAMHDNGTYRPDNIQSIINEVGVEKMIPLVNEHFSSTGSPIHLDVGVVAGRKRVY